MININSVLKIKRMNKDPYNTDFDDGLLIGNNKCLDQVEEFEMDYELLDKFIAEHFNRLFKEGSNTLAQDIIIHANKWIVRRGKG